MATLSPRTRRHFTVRDVERMVESGVLREGEHVELIDGELIELPPQGPLHSDAATDLRDALIAAYGAAFLVREAKPVVAGDGQLPEPDVAVFRRGAHERGRTHPHASAAVLLVEIAKTSLLIDHEKAHVYAAGGAPTYWIVDLVAQRLEVHQEPQPDGRYRLVRVLAGDDRVSLPELGVDWRVGDLFR